MKAYQRCSALALLLFVSCAQPALADGQSSNQSGTPGQKNSATSQLPAEGQDAFRGLKWGLGVAVSSSLGGIGSVAIDPTTKVLRVTKLNSSAARGAFELHYFFKFCNKSGMIFFPTWTAGAATAECPAQMTQFGMGPFVSLNTSPFDSSGNFSSNTLFDSVGVGWMIGLNAYDAPGPITPSTTVHTLNFGVGAILDTGVVKLANGLQDGQVTTLTSQDTLTVKTTKIGLMAIVSYRLFELNLK